MRPVQAISAAVWIFIGSAACDGSDDEAPSGVSPGSSDVASAAPSAAPASMAVRGATPSPGSSVGAATSAPPPAGPGARPAAPSPPTMAGFRAEADRDPAAFRDRPVALDVLYVRISQRMYGYSTQHVGGTLPVLHVAFPEAPEDTIACQMNHHQWPPAGVKVGDTIHVEGVWSFDRLLSGGTVAGGGPLEIHACKVSKPSPASPRPAASSGASAPKAAP